MIVNVAPFVPILYFRQPFVKPEGLGELEGNDHLSRGINVTTFAIKLHGSQAFSDRR